MIFVTDKGRLANNIFQYGHLYAWGREHGRTTMSMRFAYKYPEFRIAHTHYHNFLLYILAKYAAKLHLIPTVQFNIMNDPFLEQQKTMLNSKYVLATGWCVRFPDLFEKYKDEIISLFEFMPKVRQHVAETMRPSAQDAIKLGVHIRRGDYRTWCGGIYFFDDYQYISIIQQFCQLHPEKTIDVYICSNDPQLDKELYRQQLRGTNVYFPCGTPAEDLCLLSECNYIIGAPSSFTLVASMYNDTPLYWIADIGHQLNNESFHTFNYQARHFDGYYIDETAFLQKQNESQPLVSLIISAYNTENYIEQCIESVLSQDYQHWELLVVNDGSTDNTPAICDKYASKDNRIIVIHKKNTGQSDSRNIALQKAKGEFIGFIDSDDWIEPDFCKTLLVAIEQTGKDCATCGYLNEFVGETIYDPVSQKLLALSRNESIEKIYNRRLYAFLHGRLYRRSMLKEPIPQLNRYEDFAVLYKWFSHGNGMALCPRFLYHYRQRKGSIMNIHNDHMFGYVSLLEECFHYSQANHIFSDEHNKLLLVRNCIRIAKGIARNYQGNDVIERLETIRQVLLRVQPISKNIVDSKCYWRMRLLCTSAYEFKLIMRISHPCRGERNHNKTFFK